MRKVIACMLALSMAASLAACGSSSTGSSGGSSAGTTAAAAAPAAQDTQAAAPAAETPAAAPAAAQGGVTADGYKSEIIIAMADEFTEPDPMETTAETNQIVQDCTHDLLTDTNLDTMQNAGELVDHWEMKDPTHWSFTLKSGVKFHDGTILDTDDVEFTIMERAPKHAATAAYAEKIKTFTKVDDLTFEVELVNGDVDFNYTLAANSLAILSKEAFESMPEEDAVKIGTGPWMYKEIVAGDHVTLTRFDDCTLYDVPHTETLTFRMIPEASARMIALENNEVDVIMSPSATDYARLEEDPNLALVTEVGRGQHFIGFNLKNADSVVSNVDFRRALAQAVDKEEMIIAAWDGYAQVSTNWHCRDVGYYSEIEGIPFDPDAAKAAFDALGMDGKTIKLVTSDADHRQKMATNLQAQLSQYGIDVQIETMQNSALTELNTSDGTTSGVELTITSWTPGKNADYMYRNPIYSTGGRNYCHVDDPEIDALIDEGAAEPDPARRQEIYTKLQTMLVEDMVAMVPVAQATLTLGTRAGVTGCQLHPGLVHQFKKAELKLG